jgi:hypothetical protein
LKVPADLAKPSFLAITASATGDTGKTHLVATISEPGVTFAEGFVESLCSAGFADVVWKKRDDGGWGR